MGFANEGSIEIVIQGMEWHEVVDFDGEVVRQFSNYATATGAQRDANIKKIVIKKEAAEEQWLKLYSCIFTLGNGREMKAFLVKENGRWFGPSHDANALVEKAVANRLSEPGM